MVSVSSTKPAATSWNRKRSSVSSGSRPVGLGARDAAVQALLEPGQQQRLQRRDDEQRVARRARPRCGSAAQRLARVGEAMRRAARKRHQRAQRGHRQDRRCPTAGSLREQPGQHGHQHREPRDERQRLRKRQIEPVRREHGAHDRDRVQRRAPARPSASGSSGVRRGRVGPAKPRGEGRTGRRRRRTVKSRVADRRRLVRIRAVD